MLDRIKNILEGLQVYPEKMRENIAGSYGLHNSQKVMLALTAKALTREKAYAIVQRNATKSWKEKKEFKGLLLKDREVRKYITPKMMNDIFDLRHYFRNVDYLFTRVFGKGRA
jgi:adenylosuccinate lyase